MIDLDHISHSSLSMYESCPYSWKCKYVDKITEDENIYSVFGKIIHETLEEWGKTKINGSSMNYDDMIEHTNNLILNSNLSGDDKVKMYQDAPFLIHNFLFRNMEQIPICVEQEFLISINDDIPPIKGVIDRIDGIKDEPSTWVVKDYKTGKQMSKDKFMYSKQLPIYSLAIFNDIGVLPNQSEYHYIKELKKDGYKIMSRNIVESDIKEVIYWVKNIYASIQKQNFPKISRNKYFCEHFCI